MGDINLSLNCRIFNILDALDIINQLENFDRILIKPNYCHLRDPSTGTITSPEVIEGVLTYLTKHTDKEILIGDGGAYMYNTSQKIFQMSGIFSVLEKFPEVKLIDFLIDEKVQINCRGKYLKKVDIASSCTDCGIINLPKLKAHHSAYLTVGMKNLIGLMDNKRAIHGDFMHNKIYELYSYFEPNIICTLVDGIIVMQDTEVDGRTEHMNVLLGGTDTVFVDTLCANILDIPLDKIGYLKLALNSKGHSPAEASAELTELLTKNDFILYDGARLCKN